MGYTNLLASEKLIEKLLFFFYGTSAAVYGKLSIFLFVDLC